LTIIDTPGLISAAPGKKNISLQTASKQVETMVKQKMAQPEYIIMCLEDTSDWNNATTRRTVMQVRAWICKYGISIYWLQSRTPKVRRMHMAPSCASQYITLQHQ
jgi:hypothetical protein